MKIIYKIELTVFLFLVIVFSSLLIIPKISEASSVSSSFDLYASAGNHYVYWENPPHWQYCYVDNCLRLNDGEASFSGSFSKVFNFVKDDVNQNLNFNLNKGESVSFEDNPTIGYWFITGDMNDSPPMDGVSYNQYSNSSEINLSQSGEDSIDMSVSVPIEKGNIDITSSDPSIVSCTIEGCVAHASGTVSIIVSFDDTNLVSPYANKSFTEYNTNDWITYTVDHINNNAFFKFDDIGFGFVNARFYNSANWNGGESLDYKSYAFSFASTTYTITVPEVTNTPQVSACSGTTNPTTDGATINWTYTDADNDPQTNYQIQIATDAGLTDVVQSITAPNNTDVSTVRSHVISGLTTGVTYYAGIKTYNATNGWSNANTYSSCGAFIPTDIPITPTPLNLSCTLNPVSPVAPGTSVTFTAGNTGAVGSIVYTWNDPSDSTTYTGSSFSKSYATTATYNISLTGSTTNQRETKTCTLSVQDTSSCNSSHTENQITGPQTVGGTDCQKWNCNSSYVWSATDVMCTTPTPLGTDPVATFSFDPSVVGTPSDFCGLNLTASNVSSCTLLSPSGNKDLNSHIFNNAINLNKQGNIVTVGRYTLSCTGTTTGALPQSFGTKTCLLNPDVRER